MDAIAGLAFGIIVIDVVHKMGVTEDSAVAKGVLSSGVMSVSQHLEQRGKKCFI